METYHPWYPCQNLKYLQYTAFKDPLLQVKGFLRRQNIYYNRRIIYTYELCAIYREK